jgi:MFS family permease
MIRCGYLKEERQPAADSSYQQRVTKLSFPMYLVSTFVSDFVFPIFLTFLPLLAYELGANSLLVGLVGGSAYAIDSFMPFVLGVISDRIASRSFFMISAFALLSFVSFLYFIATSPIVIILGRVIEGISWAILWPSLEAGIATDSPMEARRAFSLYNVTWSAASTVGPLVGAVLVSFASYRFAFLFTTLMLLVALILNSLSLLSTKRNPKESSSVGGAEAAIQNSSKEQGPPPTLSDESLRPTHRLKVALYFIATALVAMTGTVTLTFFPPFAHSLGISVLVIGIMVFTFGTSRFVIYTLTTFGGIRSFLVGSIERNRNIIFALAFLLLASLAFPLARGDLLIYVLAFATTGATYAITCAITQVGIIVESPSSKRGRAAGTYESAIGIGACAGPIVAGIFSATSLATAFYLPVFTILAVLIIFPVLARRTNISN